MENNNKENNEEVGSDPQTNSYSPQSASNFHLLDQSASNPNNVGGKELHRASDLLMAVSVCTDDNRSRITELADAAMEKLTKAALDGDPLWQPQQAEEAESYYSMLDLMKLVEVEEDPHFSALLDLDFGNYKLGSGDQYNNTNFYTKEKQQDQQHLQTEFSKQTEYVRMDPLRIVGFLMDLEQWPVVFADIVSRAAILQIWTSMEPGGPYHGTLQVMTAEFHIPTPIVETRECYFGRFCKQVAPYTWAVVDVSLEDLFPYPSFGFSRKPSGCLIQPSPDGMTKVTWVEDVEVDNRLVHKMFQPYINSGLAFGAKRWISSLVRYCTWQDTLMSMSTSTINGVSITQVGRSSVLKLAERMTRSFYSNVSASKENSWLRVPVHGPQDVMIMTQKPNDNDPGRPSCTSVVFATSVHIPVDPKIVFQYLRHEKARSKWDILSYGYLLTELTCFINGDDSRNRVSIIQVKSRTKVEIFYLQESFFNASGSYVVFTPIDVFAMSVLLRGGNPDNMAILSSGFAVLPDSPRVNGQEDESDGSIVTIGLNIIDHSIAERIPFDSMVSLHRIMTETVASIKDAFNIQKV